ncbi:MAG: CoA transferase, partial [Alphaproteobacteria bacterium]|nr:CoA transferase [Alphaproteobacteria bacterium]
MTKRGAMVGVLNGLHVVQLGPGLAAAVAGRLFADAGAAVAGDRLDRDTPLAQYLNLDKDEAGEDAVARADLIVVEGRPSELRAVGRDPAALRAVNPTAAIVTIAPFGQQGPRAEDPASDLTLLYASGIARLLTGQVDDLAEAPIRPVG